MALALGTNPTPGTGTSTTATTGAFTPASGSLLVAYGSGQFIGGGGTQTLTIASTPTQTWNQLISERGTISGGIVIIWWAQLSSAPGSTTVTVTTNGTGAFIGIDVWTGAKTSLTGTVTAGVVNDTATTAASVSLTTTTAGSWVAGIVNDPDTNATFTANANTSKINAFQNSTGGAVTVQCRAPASTGTPGALTYGGTLSASNKNQVAFVEVLAAPASKLNPPFMATKARTRSYFF